MNLNKEDPFLKNLLELETTYIFSPSKLEFEYVSELGGGLEIINSNRPI